MKQFDSLYAGYPDQEAPGFSGRAYILKSLKYPEDVGLSRPRSSTLGEGAMDAGTSDVAPEMIDATSNNTRAFSATAEMQVDAVNWEGGRYTAATKTPSDYNATLNHGTALMNDVALENKEPVENSNTLDSEATRAKKATPDPTDGRLSHV
jgi:hypothetical protein